MDWDPVKRLSNLRKHGLDFRDADTFDLENAQIDLDEDWTPDEPREVATGVWRNRICVLVYIARRGTLRVISFRKATQREVRDYVQSVDRET